MTPDYTYGHTVTKSVNDYLKEHAGWEMVTNQVSPLGTQDFSQYLTNIANSGAEFRSTSTGAATPCSRRSRRSSSASCPR
jgi:hypothetical protein